MSKFILNFMRRNKINYWLTGSLFIYIVFGGAAWLGVNIYREVATGGLPTERAERDSCQGGRAG